MKRLIMAEHDIGNRDVAFIDINGKFYEDATHALCIRKYLKDIKSDIGLESYQYRPNIQDISELSKDGYIVLGHLVKKEDGVFVIYAIENERFMEFDDIPKQYIDEISNHYSLPCYDDTKDKRDPINDTDYDGETNTDIFLDRKNDVIEEDLKEAKEILKENGFKEKDHFYTNGKNTNIYLRHTTSYVFSIGFAEQSFKNEDIDRMVKIKSGLFNKLESVNAKYTQVEYERIIATFKNKDSDISYDIRFDVYVDGGNGQIINAEDNEKVTQAVYKLYEEKRIDVTQKIDSESIDFLYNFKYDPSAEVEMKPLDEYDDELDELDLDLDLDPDYEDFDFSLESFGKRSK